MFGRKRHFGGKPEERSSRWKGLELHPSHDHHPPHPPHGPPFGHFPPFPPPPFGPPLPVGRKAFHELRRLIILSIISEAPDGITGYVLQEEFNFPRGTLLRTLEKLEQKGHLETKSVPDGRQQKYYFITDQGREYLKNLKKKWANQLAFMSEMAPPYRFGDPFLKKTLKFTILNYVKGFEQKQDAEDFFRRTRSWMTKLINHIEKKLQHLKRSKSRLDNLIEFIHDLEDYDPRKVKDKIKDLMWEDESRQAKNN